MPVFAKFKPECIIGLNTKNRVVDSVIRLGGKPKREFAIVQFALKICRDKSISILH